VALAGSGGADPLVAAAFALSLTSSLAAKVTFYGIATPTMEGFPISETYVPIGVGSDGATTYSEERVASVYAEGQTVSFYTSGGKTLSKTVWRTTFTSNPATFHATLVADATHFSFHQDSRPTGIFEKLGEDSDCKFDEKGNGVCVNKVWADGEGTVTATATGTAIPYYTLDVPDSQTTGSTKGNAAATGVAVGSMMGLVVVTFGVVFGYLLIL